MSHRWRRAKKVRRPTPIRGCRECGSPVASWREHPLCRGCVRKLAEPEGESFRATRRKLAGRCAVCGGPWPDGSGCEHCPKVLAPLPAEGGEA